MKKLSVVLATYNEEANIKDCLNSVKSIADEIIVIDGSSIDKTVEIAEKLKAKVYVVANKMMFHKNKQLALEKASHDWILQLDADERVTLKLGQEILKVLKNKVNHFPAASKKTTKKTLIDKDTINAYYIPRKNYFLGSFLKKGGQYPDYVIRLVRKGKAYFPCQSVHEQIRVKGQVGYLKNELLHLSNPTFSHYLRNANRYTTLSAAALAKNKTSLGFLSKLNFLVWQPIKTFFLIYFRHKGFMDGFPGFVFAFFSGFHYFLSFTKYWESKKVKNSFSLAKDWE